VPGAERAGSAEGSDGADGGVRGGRGIERQPLSAGPERLIEPSERESGLDANDQIGRLVFRNAIEAGGAQ
jgi:hypothetical protein